MTIFRGEIRQWRRVSPREGSKGEVVWSIEGKSYSDNQEAYFDGDSIILISIGLFEAPNHYVARRGTGEMWKLEKNEEIS